MTWISYAQNFEDVTLLRALGHLPCGFYIDVGAHHPTADSVTRAFYDRGWSGINIEPVQQGYALLLAERPRDINLCAAISDRDGESVLHEVVGTGLSTLIEATAQTYGAEGLEVRRATVPVMRLDAVCERHAAGREIHFLKIDVEGAEREVLAGLDLSSYRPWVVVVEATRPRSSESNHEAWDPLLLGRGYQFAWFDGLNRFYVADERELLRDGLARPPSVHDGYIRYTEWFLRKDVADYAALLRGERDRRCDAEARVVALLGSRSWRWSAPARLLSTGLKKAWMAASDRGARGVQALEGQAEPGGAPGVQPVDRIEPEALLLRSGAAAAATPPGGAAAEALPPPARAVRLLPEKPRLALVTPWPPAASGVADAAAGLLPGLQAYFHVEVVATDAGHHAYDDRPPEALGDDAHEGDRGPARDAPGVAHPLTIRRVGWFERYAGSFDRICHHLGNALVHEPSLDLLERHGGTVVVHDVLLSDLLWALQRTGRRPHAWTQALYASHGWPALADARERGIEAAVRSWPASAAILRRADGLILHSDYARRWVQRFCGHGPVTWTGAPLGAMGLPDLAVVPLPQALLVDVEPEAREQERARARVALALPQSTFVVASFGVVDRSKMHDLILASWDALQAGLRASGCTAMLVFVGACHDPDLAALAEACGVRLTGRVTAQTFRDWLLTADVAVQLRRDSRGESSGALLQVFAAAVPAVVNRHGPMADLPQGVACMLPETPLPQELAAAVLQLQTQPGLRIARAKAAQRHLQAFHDPSGAALQHAQAIERYAARGRPARQRSLLAAWRGVAPQVSDVSMAPGAEQLSRSARVVALSKADPGPRARTLWVDVSALRIADLGSGVQRVTRNFLRPLLERGVEGWSVEPVSLNHGRYWTARAFAAPWLAIPPALCEGLVPDEPVATQAGDVFFGLDLVTDGVHQHEHLFRAWSQQGVRIAFMVHDLLPISHPHWFPPTAVRHFRGWWQTVCRTAHILACNSRATAASVAQHWLPNAPPLCPPRPLPVVAAVGLGADLEVTRPASNCVDGSEAWDAPPGYAAAMRAGDRALRPVLMVGTVEPRKGVATVVEAMQRWWQAGGGHPLVIAGRAGWMIHELEGRLRSHPELGRRLFWLEHVRDAQLSALYAHAEVLVMASHGEGYGLPVVEALSRGLPVLARDLPVFREIAGSAAGFFAAPQQNDPAWGAAGAAVQRDADALWPILCGVLSGQRKLPDPATFRVPRWEAALERLVPLLMGAGARLHRSSADAAAVSGWVHGR